MAMNENPHLRTIQSFTLTTVGFAESILSFIPNPFSIKKERDTLLSQNVKLKEEINSLREEKLENAHLRAMLDFKQQRSDSLIPADVIGKNIHFVRNTITLNMGSSDGIKVNMPIISVDGLVGRVTAVSGNYSIGQILFHRDCRVSATIERSRTNGIVSWNGGIVLSLNNIVKSVDIQPGDRVVTSQFSSMYPPNIEIGVVASTHQVPETIFQEVIIQPSVDFSKLERVFVLLLPSDSEQVSLEKVGVK